VSEPVLVERQGPLQVVRLTRADKKNSLTSAMYRTLTAAFTEANADDGVHALVMLGQPGIFCAGNDIGEFLEFARGGALGRDVIDFLHALVDNARPLVVGVDGAAVGIGTTMLLHADYAVASRRASFSTPFVNLGLLPEAASSLLGPQLMGHVRSFEMFVLGRPFDPERARAAGLVNEVVETGEADARALAVAQEIAAKPAEAIAIARRLMRGDTAPVKARIDEEAKLFGERLRSAEAQKAFEAFFNRR